MLWCQACEDHVYPHKHNQSIQINLTWFYLNNASINEFEKGSVHLISEGPPVVVVSGLRKGKKRKKNVRRTLTFIALV